MKLWTRISTLFRANANAMLDNMEDAIKLADLVILEMQEKEKQGRQKLINSEAVLSLAEKQVPPSDPTYVKQMRSDLARLANSIVQLGSQITMAKERRHAMFIELQQKKLEEKKGHQAKPIKVSAIYDAAPFHTEERIVEKIEQTEAENEALKELAAKGKNQN